MGDKTEPVRLVVPAEMADAVPLVNEMILAIAERNRSNGDPVRVLVEYEGRGGDLLLVHADGAIEVVDDGAPTV